MENYKSQVSPEGVHLRWTVRFVLVDGDCALSRGAKVHCASSILSLHVSDRDPKTVEQLLPRRPRFTTSSRGRRLALSLVIGPQNLAR